jgi:hypothetical protein
VARLGRRCGQPFLLVQAFGLGGVIADFGLALDLVGFLLFLVFVLARSVIGLTRAPSRAPRHRAGCLAEGRRLAASAPSR